MNIDLSKKDLINLIMGTSPYYSVFKNELVKKCGYWTGGFVDQWKWNKNNLEELCESDLYELYKICEESWKNI